jgi:ferritin-like metal-binding protein YciE
MTIISILCEIDHSSGPQSRIDLFHNNRNIMDSNSNITILRNLLDEDSRKFTCAEIQLKNNLDVWIKEADSLQLKAVLRKYLDYINDHVKKLQAFFVQENIRFISINNPVTTALIDETNSKLANCTDAVVKDVCLLACIQAINHFKISAYGTASSFAKALELVTSAALFREMEINEKNIDHKLSQLAEQEINIKAIAPILLSV